MLAQLRQLDQQGLRSVLIFDQFEEFFFVYPRPEDRRPFFEFLVKCLEILSVKVFLSLREDYLHYLLELGQLAGMRATGIDLLSQNVRYGLGNFEPPDATAIIQSLTRRARYYLEPALVERLVADLARELGTVRPIELQVVGAQVQAEGIRTLAAYEALGAEPKLALVQRYVAAVVGDCGAAQQRLAELGLWLLTDERGTRPLKTRLELELGLRELGVDGGADGAGGALDLVLGILVGSGLVVVVPEVPVDRYQLVHDYLAAFIRAQQEPRLQQVMAELEAEREKTRQLQTQFQVTEQELTQAQQTLTLTQRRTRRQVTVGLAAMGIAALVATSIAGSTVSNARQDASRKIEAANQQARTKTQQADRRVEKRRQQERSRDRS